jgi:hypothetical protein
MLVEIDRPGAGAKPRIVSTVEALNQSASVRFCARNTHKA